MFGCKGKWSFPEIHFLLTNIYSFDPDCILHSYFQFKSFPERERVREREREKREPRLEKEREKREPRSRRSSDDRTAPTSGAIDEIAQQRRRWDCAVKARSARSMSALVERSRRSSIDERTCNRNRRGARSTSALVGRSHRLSIAGKVSSSSLSLSDLGSLFSLSFSLFSEMIWTENKSVKLFPGQRSKYWSTGNEFLENFIFHCSQTCGFGGKW